jgi:hypothetical protein
MIRLEIRVIGGADLSIELYLGQAGALSCSSCSRRIRLQSEVNATVAAGRHLLILRLFVHTIISALLRKILLILLAIIPIKLALIAGRVVIELESSISRIVVVHGVSYLGVSNLFLH